MSDNEPIAWSQLTANQRNALIAQHIFDRKVVKWHPERDMLMQREGAEGHESIPRYSESMDAAWKVLQRLQEIHVTAHTESGLTAPDVFLSEIGLCRVPWHNNEIVMFTLKDLVALTPERICVTALKVLGLIIEIEESKQ